MQYTDYENAMRQAALAQAIVDPARNRTVPYRLGHISAVDFSQYPVTLVVGDGVYARRMRFLGSLDTYHPGQTVAYIEQPGSPLVIGVVPLTGVGENYLDDDPMVGLPHWTFVGAAGAPAFSGSWTNYTAANPADPNNPYASVSFYKQPDGWVRLQGLAWNNSGVSAPSAIFTLPVGNRPPVDMHFVAFSSSSGGLSGAGCWIEIRTNGQVVWREAGSLPWVSLANITFPTEWNRSYWSAPAYHSGWMYDVTEGESGTVEFFVRDDGWVWIKGVLVGSGVGAGTGVRAVDLPPRARIKDLSFLVAGLGIGVASYEASHLGMMINRAGYDVKNVIGGMHWFGTVGSHITWQAPALVNSWANYINANPTLHWERAGYYRDHMGIVHLRGLIQNGSAPTIFTLPVGYRPKERQLFLSVSAGGSPDTYARIDILANGTVAAVAYGSNNYLSLNNISFRAEQ